MQFSVVDKQNIRSFLKLSVPILFAKLSYVEWQLAHVMKEYFYGYIWKFTVKNMFLHEKRFLRQKFNENFSVSQSFVNSGSDF